MVGTRALGTDFSPSQQLVTSKPKLIPEHSAGAAAMISAMISIFSDAKKGVQILVIKNNHDIPVSRTLVMISDFTDDASTRLTTTDASISDVQKPSTSVIVDKSKLLISS